ncbi:MAG: hypothetical protein AB7O50_04375 [Pseudolabrys sp.]
MTCRWSAGLVFGLAVAAAPALAQAPSPPQPDAVRPAEVPVTTPPPVTAAPKVLETPAAAPLADPKARFQFLRVGDNVLKLDGDSGAVSLCSARAVEWTCQTVPQDRAALDKEIERLRSEIADLKGEIAAGQALSRQEVARLNDELKAVKHAIAPPPPAAPERSKLELKLPTAQDYERARAVVEEAWRRLVEGVAQVQTDVMRKL